MGLFEDLSSRTATFYFVERDGLAYEASWALIAAAARWFQPGEPFANVPDVLPVLQGSYLPFQAARDRWAFPDVWAVAIGFSSARLRSSLVRHIRRRPPMGMFDLDADSDRLDLPLVPTGFIVPDGYIRLAGIGRSLDRRTGLDVIGLSSEEEGIALGSSMELDDPYEGHFETALLTALSRSTGRRMTQVRANDGFDALLDHAFELFHLRAIGAAGAVGGVAFERLMQAALVEPDRRWLSDLQVAGSRAQLNDVIAKVASKRKLKDSRLRRYQKLRNDLAHRLGDDHDFTRDDSSVQEAVEEMLWWLHRQNVGEDGHAVLEDVDEHLSRTPAEIFAEACAAGDAAAVAARTTSMTIEGETIEPFGFAWVTIRNGRHPFARWLLENAKGHSDDGDVKITAPGESLERNLAWAGAVSRHLLSAGIIADYGAAPN